jgi:hypothetical protein
MTLKKFSPKIMDSEVWEHPTELKVLMCLIFKCRERSGMAHGIMVGKGQLIAGAKKISQWSGIPVQQIRTAIREMMDRGEVDCEVFTEKGKKQTLITVVNYSEYQKAEVKEPVTRGPNKKYLNYTEDFETWWKLYKKGNKNGALQPWMRDIDLLPPIETLMQKTREYIAYCEENDRERMDGQGWINQHYYENDWTHEGQGTNDSASDGAEEYRSYE